MTSPLRILMSSLSIHGRSWKVWIVLSVLGLLLVSRLAEYLLVAYDEQNWERVLDAKCGEYLDASVQEFSSVQRTTRRIATELSQRPALLDYLAGRTADRTALFTLVSTTSHDQDVGIEVYDRDGTLVAWEGRSGPPHRREVRIALDGQMTSYVSRTSVYSQLFITTPVRELGGIVGAILVRRTVEVNYPLNNAFISSEGLSDGLSQRLGVNVDFDFSADAGPNPDGRYVSGTLYGIDSSKVGVVSVQRPARSAFLESTHARFLAVNECLLVLLLAFAAVGAGRLAYRAPAWYVRILGVTTIIWLARYSLVWLDVPGSLVSSGIFDPANFASQFGGGLTKSIGEMVLTAAALVVNIAFVGRLILQHAGHPSAWWRPQSALLRVILTLAITAVVFSLLHGYGAAIRSAVFDSTLRYSDTRVIFPSVELGVMMVNLFLVSMSLIVVAVGAVFFILSLSYAREEGGTGAPGNLHFSGAGWLVTVSILIMGAWAYGALPIQANTTLWYRLLFVTGIILLVFLLRPRWTGALRSAAAFTFLLVLGFSALLLYPLLDENVQAKDRQRVEVFATEVLRPVDSWFTFVVDEGLQEFAADSTVDILQNGTDDDVEKLAFTRWAQSLACREGYASLFAVTDTGAHEISRFVIGGQIGTVTQVDSSLDRLSTKTIQVREIGVGITAVKVYAGSTPIRAGGDTLLGFGRVIVAASQQTLFRGENPAILRSASQEDLETFYRPVMISEFRDGVLLTSDKTALPIGYRLSELVREQLGDSVRTSLWAEETVGGQRYQSFFVRRDGDDVISLSLADPGFVWHLIGIVKMLLYCFAILLVVSAGALGIRVVRGKRYSLTFRDKLLLSFLVAAVVPLVLVAVYGRVYGAQRLKENVAKTLGAETSNIVQDILELPDTASGQDPRFLPATAEDIASDVGTDYSLYVGTTMRVSSRPELYEAGMLDARISGSAYMRVYLRGERFFVEPEGIGQVQYAVGYRPLLDPTGKIAGIVAVPTLYRQDDIQEEMTRRNAFVFGVYGIVLLFILGVSTALANRIAAPIQRLTEATRKVSQGELDVSVNVEHADAEIGELVRSFETMTQALKRSREDLVRYERELAWKEMARQVAHEIKNPLTPIKLSIQHLRQTYKDKVPDFDRVLSEVTKTVIEQIDTLSRIASEFSNFARMPKRQLEECDLNGVLAESVHLFDREENVEFEFSRAPGLPQVIADREELRRAFINIIRNSIQAMEGRGKVRLTTGRDGDNVLVSIGDSGPGIPDEIRDKLFEPNFSTKTDGMGLGLAIVKKTVDDLGGTIMVQSVSGEGTTVTLLLPASAGPEE